MSSPKKRKPKRRKISSDPVSHSPRLEAITGYRKPGGKRRGTESASVIFNEEEVDHDGVPLRVPADNAELASMGQSTLNLIAFQCGEEVPALILADIGRARSVLEDYEVDSHQLSYELDASYPLHCHEAGALLELVHAVGGFSMNIMPILLAPQVTPSRKQDTEQPPPASSHSPKPWPPPSPLQKTFWAALQMAYDAGRLAAKLEGRPAEPLARDGADIPVHLARGPKQRSQNTQDDIATAQQKHAAGSTIPEIAEKTGLTKETVRKHIGPQAHFNCPGYPDGEPCKSDNGKPGTINPNNTGLTPQLCPGCTRLKINAKRRENYARQKQ